jgi:haloalkane dehalogenase
MRGDQVRYCTVGGYCLAYYRRGRGEPLLLVHGITTYSFIWRRVGPLLEKLHREISGSRLVRIPGAGHFIQEDEPEETAAAILDFLGGTGG